MPRVAGGEAVVGPPAVGAEVQRKVEVLGPKLDLRRGVVDVQGSPAFEDGLAELEPARDRSGGDGVDEQGCVRVCGSRRGEDAGLGIRGDARKLGGHPQGGDGFAGGRTWLAADQVGPDQRERDAFTELGRRDPARCRPEPDPGRRGVTSGHEYALGEGVPGRSGPSVRVEIVDGVQHVSPVSARCESLHS